MTRYAVLDIGTNSMKFLLAEHDEGRIEIIKDELDVSRLGESLHESGAIPFSVMERNLHAIARFAELARQEKVDKFEVFSTAVLRRAENAEDFLKLVKKELNISINIISREDEAQLAFEAVKIKLDEPETNYMVFDIGGGSTEFTISQHHEIIKQISLPVGALIMQDKFIKSDPPTEEEVKSVSAYLQTILQKHFAQKVISKMLAIGGTVTTLAAVKMGLDKYDAQWIDGLKLTKGDINNMVKCFANITLEERKQIQGLHPKRADIILAGTLIVKAIMEVAQQEQIIVHDCGIRHGMINKLITQVEGQKALAES